MGTNYYVKTDRCKSCGHKEEGVHLGKSSIGWIFSFQLNGGIFYKNIEEMKQWLIGKEIEDEYDKTISHTEFWEMVEAKQLQESNKSHANQTDCRHSTEIDGYSFTDCEFC